MDRSTHVVSPSTYLMPSHQTLPLTKENLSRIVEQDSSFSLLTRYCNDYTPPPSPLCRPRPHTPTYRRKDSLSGSEADTVMASPRQLPFPYHNDSLFLPTAEQYHVSSRLSLDERRPRRPSSTTEHYRASSPLAGASLPKRHASAPPSFDKARRALVRTPSMTSAASSASSASTLKATDEKHRPLWLKRVIKLFSTLKRRKSFQSERKLRSCRRSEAAVWYSQYAANPPPPSGLAGVAA
ncbi:hypothetical protein BCR43DRAFT_490924 [Syncephalastrum racemosum]|uniref:Uncharacterized protein n=1 Tax=Syncephalastrum racemosum TaxID=13706 RepID=A0A1X2HGN4_SYNRA|nr:hypothetical protein BCR43DRAFT_490924 [Syncephalastrum racemosum]